MYLHIKLIFPKSKLSKNIHIYIKIVYKIKNLAGIKQGTERALTSAPFFGFSLASGSPKKKRATMSVSNKDRDSMEPKNKES